jgi:hypothetical protein
LCTGVRVVFCLLPLACTFLEHGEGPVLSIACCFLFCLIVRGKGGVYSRVWCGVENRSNMSRKARQLHKKISGFIVACSWSSICTKRCHTCDSALPISIHSSCPVLSFKDRYSCCLNKILTTARLKHHCITPVWYWLQVPRGLSFLLPSSLSVHMENGKWPCCSQPEPAWNEETTNLPESTTSTSLPHVFGVSLVLTNTPLVII